MNQIHHEVIDHKRLVAFTYSVQVDARLGILEYYPRVERVDWHHEQNSNYILLQVGLGVVECMLHNAVHGEGQSGQHKDAADEPGLDAARVVAVKLEDYAGVEDAAEDCYEAPEAHLS